MAIVRRLAVKILNAVVRLASTGCKEWAVATLRELDFIENDWSALVWALGCARIIFIRRDVPVADFSDIRRDARKIRRSTLGDFVATIVAIVVVGRCIFIFTNQIERLGYFFLAASLLYSAYQHFALRVREVPDETDHTVYAISHRENLVRQRDLHSGRRLWSRMGMMFSGFILLSIGRAITKSQNIWQIAVLSATFIALSIFTVLTVQRKAQKYQRQIDELDALPKEL